jgi:hypothetical protein
MNSYQQAGYENRTAYLEELSDIYEIELSTVFMLADIFGEVEDFDMLVTTLSDLRDDFEEQ